MSAAVLLDIIGASIIVGIVILSIFGLVANLNQSTYEKTFSLNMQTNAVTLARIMEWDILKIGYHTTKPAILYADSTSITFKADLMNVGDTNLVQYHISDPSEPTVAGTINPRDRMIYREASGQSTMAANLGLTNLKFTYLDSTGNPTTISALIKAIHVKMRFESPEPVDTTYASVYWEKTIYPRNL